jgi:hypothetical protein
VIGLPPARILARKEALTFLPAKGAIEKFRFCAHRPRYGSVIGLPPAVVFYSQMYNTANLIFLSHKRSHPRVLVGKLSPRLSMPQKCPLRVRRPSQRPHQPASPQATERRNYAFFNSTTYARSSESEKIQDLLGGEHQSVCHLFHAHANMKTVTHDSKEASLVSPD